MMIDWDDQLEAVHENGDTMLVSGYGGCPGDLATSLPGGWISFEESGFHASANCPWHIRNAIPNDDELVAKLANAIADRRGVDPDNRGDDMMVVWRMDARAVLEAYRAIHCMRVR